MKLSRNLNFKLRRYFSNQRLLTSDFIHNRLYAKNDGYFSKKDVQLGLLEEPIEFSSLLGYEDYQKILVERYPKNAWLTPSEIFKPWYGMTIGNYINDCWKNYQSNDQMLRDKRLKIIEVGAGNGSAASSILNYFKLISPNLYNSLEYKIIEISPIMIERCRKNLSKDHPNLIKKRNIKFINQSIVDYKAQDNDIVFILFLEVLDNMPHDRVYIVNFIIK